MLKAIKIRIYPDAVQMHYINCMLGTSRFVYNDCLAYRIAKYNEEGRSVGFAELGKHLVALKSEEDKEWIKDTHSKVLQQSLINLEHAYKSFFNNGTGFPRFKSKHDTKQSCRFPSDAFIGVEGNRISLIRQLKNIHFKCSVRDERILNRKQSSVRSATMSRDLTGRYHLSVLLDSNEMRSVRKPVNDVVGVDLGIKTFLVDSRGNEYRNLKLKRTNEKKLSRLHRSLSKKVLGSRNREKSKIRLARFYSRINDRKEYYLHEVANRLLDENQVVAIENLNVMGMMQNHSLARSIQELSLSRFGAILKYKAGWMGRSVVEVDRFFPSSKLCSVCGHKKTDLKLSDRTWACPSCGAFHDRDRNAATNIEREGRRIVAVGTDSKKVIKSVLGPSLPESTPAESGSVDDIGLTTVLKSTHSSKQEGKVARPASVIGKE